jgi:hypothetical protein
MNGASTFRIHTRERRYLLADAAPVEALLRPKGAPLEYVSGQPESRILTVYLDTPEGTWSEGRTRTKFRCKQYADPEIWWFELKRRAGNVVDKWRRSLPAGEVAGMMDGTSRWDVLNPFVKGSVLRPLVGVRYRRLAWEWGNLRVTIDRGVEFLKVAPGTPWTIGEPAGALDKAIVEVKHDGPVPEWLAPALAGFRAPQFSKSRQALIAIRGRAWTSAS